MNGQRGSDGRGDRELVMIEVLTSVEEPTSVGGRTIAEGKPSSHTQYPKSRPNSIHASAQQHVRRTSGRRGEASLDCPCGHACCTRSAQRRGAFGLPRGTYVRGCRFTEVGRFSMKRLCRPKDIVVSGATPERLSQPLWHTLTYLDTSKYVAKGLRL